MRGVREFDTYGAWLLERLTRQWRSIGGQPAVVGMPEHDRTLLKEMSGVNLEPAAPPARPNPIVSALAAVGRGMTGFGRDLGTFANMLGAIGVAATRVIARPRDFRFTSAVNQLDRVCWQAVPIILLITFLIGAIIAQQGIFHFRKFGAEMYAVDLVGILILREVGVLIVAIMVAGRSGSSYTAELGSMMMREEVDALRTMGFDPVEVLILPRVLVLIIALPILTFLGSMAALYGGGVVAWLYGGMSPEIYISRLEEAISLTHFKVGMIKAPFMGLVIGVVACAEGPAGQGQRRVAWSADHGVGGEVDLPRHRARRPVRDLLRLDRNVMNAKNKPVISDQGPRRRLRRPDRARPSVARGAQRRDPRRGRQVRRRQVGVVAHHHRASAEAARQDRGARRRSRHRDRAGAPSARAPLGRIVSAGRAVLLAHRAAERAVSQCARISKSRSG